MVAAATTVLIVEDEPHIVLGLTDALAFEGFEVITAETGARGIELARQKKPGVVLLDLMLPDQNGYEVCDAIRKGDRNIPIIMLTARSQEVDKIRGLDVGADDYVTKPFSVGELVARIRAILRRASLPPAASRFKLGHRAVNLSAQVIEYADGRTAKLSYYEVELLRMLHERPGQPVSREEILDKIWGVDANPTNRTIDNFIVKLRKKLEERPEHPAHILTVHGYGYKLVV